MLKLATTGYTIVKSAQASWLYLTFCLWLRRIIAVSPHHFSKLVPMVRQAYPFFVFVLKDSIVLDHRKHVELVRVSSKYVILTRFINKAKNKKMSLLDTLSGFLRNDSDSEEEDPHLLKVLFS